MFATFLAQLPAKHTGGVLVVKQGDEKRVISHTSKSAEAVFTTAFFCDCEHTLLPITSGYRLALVYNMVRVRNKAVAVDPSGSVDITDADKGDTLKTAIRMWTDDDSSPAKFVWRLGHKQTKATLSFDSLRPGDQQIVKRLCNLKEDDGVTPLLNVALALTEHRSDPFYDDESVPKEKGRFYVTAKHTVQGTPVEKVMLISPCEILDMSKFFRHYKYEEEDTGNDGFEPMYVYRDTSVVFWPRRKTPQILAEPSIGEFAGALAKSCWK